MALLLTPGAADLSVTVLLLVQLWLMHFYPAGMLQGSRGPLHRSPAL